jgi:hypothetical protein
MSSELRACEEQWQQGSGSKRTRRHEGERKWEGYRRERGEESEREKWKEDVEKVGGGVKALCPEARGQGGLDQKSAHDIVRGPNHALCLAVMWGSIRTRHT